MSGLKRILVLAFVGMVPTTLLLAQKEASLRSYGGWSSVSNKTQQTAFYQPQAGLPDLNSLPTQPMLGSSAPATSSNSGQSFPALPQSYPGGGTNSGNPGGSGTYPPTPALLPQNPGNGAPPAAAPKQIPNSPSQNGLTRSGPTFGGQYPAANQAMPMAGQPTASSAAVMPPGQSYGATPASQNGGDYASSGTPGSGTLGTRPIMPVDQATPNSGSFRNLPGQTIGYQQQPTNGASGNRLRGIDAGPTSPTGRYDPNTIASGPPFVTPAPRSRYPTSPYNRALFQTVAFQRAQSEALASAPVSAGGKMQLANTQLPNSQTFAPQPLAAQPALQTSLQATPGIYPTAYQCQPAPTLPAGTAPTYAPGTITPNLAPTVYSGNNAGLKPLLSLGQENFNVQLGRGIIGQPTVYVPRQPIRNFFRYIFP